MRQLSVLLSLFAAVVAACTEQDPPSADEGKDLSPLAEYLGEGAVSFEGGFALSTIPNEDMLRNQREVDRLIAECMRAQGFEYIPLADWYVPTQHDEAWALPEDEFTAQYGYGVSTILPEVDRPEDPNEAIREAMTPAEHEAYRAALHGVQANGWSGETPPPLSDSGCAGKATEQVFDHLDEFGRDAQREALLADLSALDARVDADRRVVEAERAWIACMADAGYADLDHIGDGQTLVSNRVDEVLGIEASEAHLPWNEADPEGLRELQQYELAVATADRACKIEYFDDAFREVRLELEAEFVEEHRNELEQLRERLAEDG